MEVTIAVGGETSGEELYSLRGWLSGEDELRGRIRVVEHPPDPGKLGSLPDALMIALGPGGVGTVLASTLIAWIRHRTTDVSLTVTCPDGRSVAVQGRRLRGLTAADLSAQVEQLGRVCGEQLGEPPDAERGA